MKILNNKLVLILGILIFAALSRLVPHPMNFTPLTAICLFSAAFINNRILRFLLPLVVMIISDIILELSKGQGFYNGIWWVYLSILAIVGIGHLFLKTNQGVKNLIPAVLLGSLAFYLITNFALLYPVATTTSNELAAYPHTWAGIMASYTAGLPFYKNMLLGDFFYTGVLFGAYFLVTKMSFFSASKSN